MWTIEKRSGNTWAIRNEKGVIHNFYGSEKDAKDGLEKLVKRDEAVRVVAGALAKAVIDKLITREDVCGVAQDAATEAVKGGG